MTRRLALLLFFFATLGAFYEWGGPAGRGVRALKARKYDQALQGIREGRRDLPLSAALLYDEALAFQGKGMIDSAGAAYRGAMRMRGEAARAAAAYNLGNDAMRAKMYGEAIRRYRDALRVKPGDGDAKRNLEEAIRMSRGAPRALQAQGSGGGDGPPTRGDDQKPSGVPRDTTGRSGIGQGPSSPGRNGAFSREEAEHWLEALESQRRASRQQGRAERREETGQRDW